MPANRIRTLKQSVTATGKKWAGPALAALCMVAAAAPAGAQDCKRPDLVWETWRDHVMAANPGADFFELRGDGRDEILRAYNCEGPGAVCPPDRLMVFHCTGNSKVLLAFVKQGCVTLAEDVSIEDYRRLVIGGDPC